MPLSFQEAFLLLGKPNVFKFEAGRDHRNRMKKAYSMFEMSMKLVIYVCALARTAKTSGWNFHMFSSTSYP